MSESEHQQRQDAHQMQFHQQYDMGHEAEPLEDQQYYEEEDYDQQEDLEDEDQYRETELDVNGMGGQFEGHREALNFYGQPQLDDQYQGHGESDNQDFTEQSRQEDQDAEYLPTAGNCHRDFGMQRDQEGDAEQLAQFQQYQEQFRREQEQLNSERGPDGNLEVKEFISDEDDEYGDQGEEALYEGEEDSEDDY